MKTHLYKKHWSKLTARQKAQREDALQVLNEMRKTGKSLNYLSRQFGIIPRSVLLNTNAFRKDVSGRWKAKKYDRIARVMKINENGKEVSIEISNSHTASLIGQYNSAVGRFLDTGNLDVLRKFHGKRIKDINGNYHLLETDADKLKSIHERREEPEFYELYAS